MYKINWAIFKNKSTQKPFVIWEKSQSALWLGSKDTQIGDFP
jgi:hypothetical protein